MAFLRQLRVILWKNIVVYSFKRHYVLTFFTMAIPLLLSGVLLYLRSLGMSTAGGEPIVRKNATIYQEFTPEFTPQFTHDIEAPIPYAPNTKYGKSLMEAVFKEIIYTDASEHRGQQYAIIVATSRTNLLACTSLRTQEMTAAEEAAITLALAQPGVRRVVIDSQQAYWNYQ